MRREPVAVIVCQPAQLPSFSAWVRMRQQCEACRYSMRVGQTSLKCTRIAEPVKTRYTGRKAQDAASCINRRDEGQACGPHAALWEPR